MEGGGQPESNNVDNNNNTKGPKDLKGYLSKKTKHGKWQQRWFETNDCFLTYYKKKGQKLLAALNLPQVGDITLLDRDHPDGPGLFTIQLNERLYTIKASTHEDARTWVTGLQERQESGNNIIPSDSSSDRKSSSTAAIDFSSTDDITRQINERVESMRSPVLSDGTVDKNVRRQHRDDNNNTACCGGGCFSSFFKNKNH